MTEFKEYKQMEETIENNIMARLHPTLKALLEGQNNLAKQLEPLTAIYKNVQTFGKVYQWTINHFVHLLLAIGGIAGAILAVWKLKDLFKH